MWGMNWSSFFIYFLHIDCQLFQRHLLKRLSFSMESPFPLHCKSIDHIGIFLDSVVYHWSMCPFCYQYHSVLVAYLSHSQLEVILLLQGKIAHLKFLAWLLPFPVLLSPLPSWFVLGTQLNKSFTQIPYLWVFWGEPNLRHENSTAPRTLLLLNKH